MLLRGGALAAALCSLLLGACGGGAVAPAAPTPTPARGGRPSSVAEVALYQGADRQQILEDGARKEGRVTLYTSNSGIETTAKEFGKKYPFLSVDVLRAGNEDLVKRVQQEYQADRVQIDAFSSSGQGILNMQTYG